MKNPPSRPGFAIPQTSLVCMAFAFSVIAARADTVWTSPITNTVTWTRAASPHTWSGRLFVEGQGEVVIEPGASVTMPTDPDISPDNYNWSWMVRNGGRVSAVGTALEPIRIGGLSDNERRLRLHLASAASSEFRHVRFTGMARIECADSSPHPSPLFEHCVFRRFAEAPLKLLGCPARVLHCIFQDNDGYAIELPWPHRTMTDQNAPTLWYNAFDQRALHILQGGGLWNFQNHDFFRHNRVASGIGIRIQVAAYQDSPRVQNLVLRDLDLGGCSPSLTVYAAGGDGLENFSLIDSHLATLVEEHAQAVTREVVLTGNYWGTTVASNITAAAFAGSLSPSAVTPFATAALFPQADVDDSHQGNATTAADADLVKRHLVGALTLSPAQRTTADVDRDGILTARDALLLDSFVNGMLWQLPTP